MAIIKMAKVIPPPQPIRQRISDESIRELAQSIAQDGLLQPIGVVEKNAKYEIIFGHRRYLACKSLGWRDIEARIITGRTGKLNRLRLVENIQREDLAPLEEAFAVAQALEDLGKSQEEFAREIGKSRSWVARRVALTRLSSMTLEAIERGAVAPEIGIEIDRVEDEAQKALLLQFAEQYGESLSTVRQKVDYYLREGAAAKPPDSAEAAANWQARVQTPMTHCGLCGKPFPTASMHVAYLCDDDWQAALRAQKEAS